MNSCPPVIFIAFNRPALTARVFNKIREAAPSRLFVVCDGPRSDKREDIQLCEEVRNIVSSVDWPCDVSFDFSETNLGCATRVSSGITKALGDVDRAVILEDDCLPNTHFFEWAGRVLKEYENDERIMHISGTSFPLQVESELEPSASIYFSRYAYMWGWATWSRAWKSFDLKMSAWQSPNVQQRILATIPTQFEREKWMLRFGKVLSGEVSSWAWPWQVSVWVQNGCTIVPKDNLVTNIGFSSDATHTTVEQDWQSIASSSPRPLVFPEYCLVDFVNDSAQFEQFMCARATTESQPSNYLKRIQAKLLNLPQRIFGR